MPDYRMKYWFEWGCSDTFCPCLWAMDEATEEKYGYSVDLNSLPISSELRDFLCRVGMKHDEALDWSYPSNPLVWTEEEEKQFYRLAGEGYQRLTEELGENYEIVDCVG